MEFKDVVYQRRTIRRFKQEPISRDLLRKLIDLARLAPASANIQSLRYIIVNDTAMRDKLFPLVRWAAHLPKDQRKPEKNKRPMAYIIVLNDTEVKKKASYDVGAAVENTLLGAVNNGLGGCWMGSINRIKIWKLFEIPEQFEITHVISLGYPAEESKTEPYEKSFKYWKDDANVMHVPKKHLDDIIYKIV